jgi:hypothetical protein
MSGSRRLSRGFHRLGLFLAAIPVLFGVRYCLGTPLQTTKDESVWHQNVACAHEALQKDPKRFYAWTQEGGHPTIDLKTIGCCLGDSCEVIFSYVENPPEFYWLAYYAFMVAPIFVLTAASSLAIYALVRAIAP